MRNATRSRLNWRGMLWATPLMALWLASCGPAATPAYFVPPTRGAATYAAAGNSLSPTDTPIIETPSPSPEPPPSPTPVCTDDLEYLQDLTIPDGSVMAPGQRIDKRWQVRNRGSCNWDQRYSLRLINGDAMGAEVSKALYPARAGTDAALQVLFTAPVEPGIYTCQWQAVNPDGTPFGDAFYMQIVVGG